VLRQTVSTGCLRPGRMGLNEGTLRARPRCGWGSTSPSSSHSGHIGVVQRQPGRLHELAVWEKEKGRGG
jgi:hypothetical protein